MIFACFLAVGVAAGAAYAADGAQGVGVAQGPAPTTVPSVAPRTLFGSPQQRDAEQRRQDVQDRQQPEYVALGTRVGDFIVFPRMELREQFSDNVYRRETRTNSDFTTTVSPSIGARSNWSRHELVGFVGADIARYSRFTAENVENVDSYLAGRYDIAPDNFINGRGVYTSYHETRDSPDNVGGRTPTPIDIAGFDLGGQYQPGRFRLKANTTYRDYDFSNVQAFTGGTINNNVRDRQVWDFAVRPSYEIVRGYYAFVEAAGNVRDYRQRDVTGLSRTSHGYAIRAGTDISLTGVLRGDVYVGYLEQSYDDSRFRGVSGYDMGANMVWNASPLTTVKLSVARTIEETTTTTSSGILQSRFELRADHELQRNIVLSALGYFANNEYRQFAREDQIYRAELSGVYKFDRNFYTNALYRHTERDSNVLLGGYTENLFMLVLGAQL